MIQSVSVEMTTCHSYMRAHGLRQVKISSQVNERSDFQEHLKIHNTRAQRDAWGSFALCFRLCLEKQQGTRTIFVMAKALCPPAVNEAPPQSPNHANHTRHVPSSTNTLLCGTCMRCLSSSEKYLREPTMKSDANAADPDDACTTVHRF